MFLGRTPPQSLDGMKTLIFKTTGEKYSPLEKSLLLSPFYSLGEQSVLQICRFRLNATTNAELFRLENVKCAVCNSIQVEIK